MNIDDKKKKMSKMISLYLCGTSSELEVNIPLHISNEIIKKTAQNRFENEIFEELEKIILSNMTDTYMRLLTTKKYLQWKEHHQFMKESNIE